MKKTVAWIPLIAVLIATPLGVARGDTAPSDSSCANSMRLNFCDPYRATGIAVGAAALAGVTVMAVRSNESSLRFCPPNDIATTTTPEPATIALVATGMLALASKRLSRRLRTIQRN
jgi:hypothetical protein